MNKNKISIKGNVTPPPRKILNFRLVFLSFVFLLSLCTFALTSSHAAFALEGAGTAESPYIITTADDLAEFRVIVNGGSSGAHAVLANDINLNNESWTPVGDKSNPYTGTFDGGGHTVSGLNVSAVTYAGLFGYVGRDENGMAGVIKNLTVDGNVSDDGSSDSCVGGVVGCNYSGTVSNCTNSGTVTGNGRLCSVGGVVGYNSSTVSNCTNSGDVKGNGESCHAGGIVGYKRSGSTSNCTNSGRVTGGGEAGGIVGYNYSGTVSNCTNSGDVTDNGNSSDAGGIVGGNYSTVSNCANTGSVTGSGNTGGVAGGNSIGTVSNCTNTGSVTGSGNTGSVVGHNQGNSNRGTVSDCAWVTGTASSAIGTDDNSGSTTTREISEELSRQIVTSLTASIGSTTITVGGTTQITLATKPGTHAGAFGNDSGAVRVDDDGGVSSSSPSIATAEYDYNGTITVRGIAEGTTTVTVKATLYATKLSTLSDATHEYNSDGSEVSFTFPVTVSGQAAEPDTTPEAPQSSGGGGGGGCSAGFGALALLALIPLAMRKKK